MLERAIDRLTKAIAEAKADEDVADLVTERREMRAELEAARRAQAEASGKVVALPKRGAP